MMYLKRIYIIFLFAILPWASSVAQDPYFKKIAIPGTAINFRIHALCQDSRKVIWIGSSEGIHRFNGLIFEQLALPGALIGCQVTAITKLNSNGVIAGTRDGKLFSVINDVVTIINPDSFDITSAISSISIDTTNQIWFATMGQGIYLKSKSGFSHLTTSNGLGDDYVYDLYVDKNNTVWAGSDGGLSYSTLETNSIKFLNLNFSSGLPDNIVRRISKGPGSTIGIGMEEKGFCFYDYDSMRFVQNDFFETWTLGPVTGLTLLTNEFWIGTPREGIVDYEFGGKNRIRKFEPGEGYNFKDISCMMTDHEGNIWIGAGSELFFSPGEKIEIKNLDTQMKSGSIRAILSDKSGNIWFSNEAGINCLTTSGTNEDIITQPLKGTKFDGLTIISLYEDIFGFIWMGTFDGGVLRFHPQSGNARLFDESSGLINANVLSISGTAKEIWFATLGGVSKCDLTDPSIEGIGKFTSYSEENGLGNNFIYKVFIDSKNRVWFGTDGKGITSFSNGIFTNYNQEKGLKSNIIYSITEDHTGNIWLSSVNDGIYKFDGNLFTNFNVKNGLSDLNISSLATDANGNLIIVNKQGIDVFDPYNYQVLTYGSDAGMKNIDPDLNVIDVDENGDVWAGIQQGILKIALEKKASAKLPIIVLDKVLCFLEQTDTTQSKSFAYNRNHISFSFFSVWYLDPMKVTYRYKLDGYNSDWITTSDRLVTFPNLSPGNYTFHIKSSLNGNFELSNTTSYSFEVQRPFWQKSWFILLGTFLFFGLFYFYLRYRDRRVQAMESLNRERIESQFEVLRNQVNPHFLFNSFNTLVSIIEDDKEVAVEYVNKLSDFFRSVLAYREKDLITIEEELELADSYIFLQQKRYGKNFKVVIDIPEDLRNVIRIPPMALQILLENCLKHNSVSSETPLHCEVYIENEYLVVSNNINLKIVYEPSTGIGLQNLRNRFKIITGEDVLAGEKDGSFIVKLPLIKIL